MGTVLSLEGTTLIKELSGGFLWQVWVPTRVKSYELGSPFGFLEHF